MRFKALRVTETASGSFERNIIEIDLDDLPPGELLIKVQYSALNFKDAMSASGNKGITRKYPHTPGIDASGIIELSRHESFSVNEEVIVTGYDLGMNTCGGFSEYIRVPAAWAVRKPDSFTFAETMTIGTAGFTAALALHKMEKLGQTPAMGPIVVTGASGGVGSMAVALLSKAGYTVTAVTGKKDAADYLQYLGAQVVENRDFVDDRSGKTLLSQRWAGAIDTVGGNTLSTLLKGCKPEGVIVCTGLVGSPQLNTTVYPFILNGISLVGVGSAETDGAMRNLIWTKIFTDWNVKEKLAVIAKEVTLDELNKKYIDDILAGKIIGRIIVNLGANG